MKKVRAQSAFIREFEGIYELQEEEIITMKEECLAERISITKVKNAAKTDKTSRVFKDNEFAMSHIAIDNEVNQKL